MLHCIARLGSRLLQAIFPVNFSSRIKRLARSILKIKRNKSINRGLPLGINLVGYFRSEMGLGEGCRILAKAVESLKIPLCAINFSVNNLSLGQGRGENRRFHKRPRYQATIVHINPDQYRLFETILPRSLWNGRYVIGFLLWELPLLPESWREGLGLLDEIWTSSNYVTNNIRSQVTIPVRTIPYGIPIRPNIPNCRQLWGIEDGRFYFLIMYDIASVMERKNPRGAVEAFIRAFSPNDDRVGIIIKINNSCHAPLEAVSLRKMLETYRNTRFIEETLSRSEVDVLLLACDAVVSLHRAEGFGLVLAEAMSFGKPVVATNWSSNIEFMDKKNSCPVDYKLVALEKDFNHYQAEGQYWAEPDIGQAAALMRRLVDDVPYRESIGICARKRIVKDFSPEITGKLVAARLRELGLWV